MTGTVLENTLQQSLKQNLTIANKLIKSLQILNMGRLELEQTLLKEAEGNPLLEVEIDNAEIDWEKFFADNNKTIFFDKNNVEYNDDDVDFENITRNIDSIYDKLHAQVSIMKLPSIDKKICRFLIDSLDKDGYLREEEWVIVEKLKVSMNDLERCIKIVQGLEPCGVGARTIEECLLLQLKRGCLDDRIKSLDPDVLEKVITDDLNLIANMNIDKLQKKYKMSRTDVIYMIDFIKSLYPKPVSMYSDEKTIYIYPDVFIEKKSGFSVAKLYKEENMKIYINNYYKDLLLNSDDKEAKKYIKEKLNSAKNIINDVKDRNTTVVGIANAIIEEQREFFDGNGELKPLSMTDLAEKLQCHVSTISRGVSDKYMLTEKGIIELKKFFTNAHKNVMGDDISTDTIKDSIKEIIDGEDKKKPLSDKKIEDLLKVRGIVIARRTIAKYREELGYLSSSKRKNIE